MHIRKNRHAWFAFLAAAVSADSLSMSSYHKNMYLGILNSSDFSKMMERGLEACVLNAEVSTEQEMIDTLLIKAIIIENTLPISTVEF